jgi:Ser/Thr protein kinase RdoA (MazF antagonist)
MLLSEVNDAGLRAAGAAWLGDRTAVVEGLEGDGFSGGVIVRLRSGDPAGDVVLKSFPEASGSRIAWAHDLMAHLRAAGCHEVPPVVVARSGRTIVTGADGRAWEAVRFVEGAATAAPDAARACAAAAAVARLHRAAAEWPAEPPRSDVPPAVTRRIEQARRMLAEPWHTLVPRADRGPLGDAVAARMAAAASVAREGGLEPALRGIAATRPLPGMLQAVIRDLWSSHVLFAADEPAHVSGIVDFHAAAIDTPATDLARLVGSWTRDPARPLAEAWCAALDAYERIRPLTDAERRLVPWFDATATIFALDNWFSWTVVEGRRFERPARVLGRVDRLLRQLPGALASLHGHGVRV